MPHHHWGQGERPASLLAFARFLADHASKKAYVILTFFFLLTYFPLPVIYLLSKEYKFCSMSFFFLDFPITISHLTFQIMKFLIKSDFTNSVYEVSHQLFFLMSLNCFNFIMLFAFLHFMKRCSISSTPILQI